MASGGRIGPWLQADYEFLDQNKWKERKPCLYTLAAPSRSIEVGTADAE